MTTIAQSSDPGDAHAARTSWLAQRTEGITVIGVNVTFQYDDNFDRARVITIAENARGTFEGMPGLRFNFFTLDDEHRRATNFYVWDSKDTAEGFFSDEMRERMRCGSGLRACTAPHLHRFRGGCRDRRELAHVAGGRTGRHGPRARRGSGGSLCSWLDHPRRAPGTPGPARVRRAFPSDTRISSDPRSPA
jgi:hypothetical protein